ncbi:MAG TPA: lysophospholipid acyltransferase family protein [Actinomycetota bacterium]
MRGGELNLWWRAGLALASPLVRLLFRVRVRGLEHVPSAGPAILAFNHVSALDGPVLAIAVGARLRRESRFLVATEFFGRPLHGAILRRFDQIPIRRGASDDGALEAAVRTVRRGALLAIAPEGTVNADGATDLQRIRSGVARVALPTGAPIVPVGIWGTQRRWPRSGLRYDRPWRPRLALAFGPPLLPTGDAGEAADVDELTARLRAHLEEQVEAARAAIADGT